METLNHKATPGFCDLARYGNSVGEILGFDGVGYDKERLHLFETAVRYRIRSLCSGVLSADDIKVFVKQEPHKASKIALGRYRLISAVSMIDTMIDRMLFGPLMKEVLAAAGKTPVMIGWVPVLGGYRLVRTLIPGRALCIDKSAWDWSVPHWMTRCWLDIVLGLCNGSPPFWEDLVRARFRILFETAIFRFEDGTRVRQEVPGIMKSGCYLTILLNSIGQLLIHYIVQHRRGDDPLDGQPLCIGDDTVQNMPNDVEAYVRGIGDLGFTVKEVRIQNWIEFAGFMIDSTTWPVYWQKHLYTLQYCPDDTLEETLYSYQMLYAKEPVMLRWIQAILVKHFPKRVVPESILATFIAGGFNATRVWVKMLARNFSPIN